MSNVRVGTAGFAVQRERYQSKLRFVEFTLRPPVPSPKVLAGWQRSSPEGFTFAAVAPDSLYGERDWPMRDPVKLQSELDRFGNQVNALGARVVVLRTPLAVSPGSVALKRFLPVLERARSFGAVLVWEPAGLWEREEALAVASDFNAVVAGDPLQNPPEENIVYARMRGLGSDQRYTMGRLEALAERIAGADEAFVVFDSGSAWREACGFAKLSGELLASSGDDEDDDLDEGDEDDEGDDDEADEGDDDLDEDG
jgi:uncharacterized protein YecE (DUF72 family)